MKTRFDRRALRRLRTAKGWDMTTLAAKSGCTKQNISLIEIGHVTPKVSTLARIASALEARPEEFFVTAEA